MSNLVTRWKSLKVGLASDLSKFYPSFKLRTEDWNLQFLWKVPSLMQGEEPELFCVTSLIFGVASVAAQSEAAMEKIAELYPDLKMILESRYVDDLAMSVMTVEEARYIMERTTSVLTAYQLWQKGWSISGEQPDPKIAADGIMLVARLLWDVLSDTFRIKIPKVSFHEK